MFRVPFHIPAFRLSQLPSLQTDAQLPNLNNNIKSCFPICFQYYIKAGQIQVLKPPLLVLLEKYGVYQEFAYTDGEILHLSDILHSIPGYFVKGLRKSFCIGI